MDRELLETPIQTSSLSIQPLRIRSLDPNFCLDINGKLLWEWRKLSLVQLSKVIRKHLLVLGYTMKEQCLPRVYSCVKARRQFLMQKIKTKKNKNKKTAAQGDMKKKNGFHIGMRSWFAGFGSHRPLNEER